jgi:tetratricopeptide (TPR) repeat protein
MRRDLLIVLFLTVVTGAVYWQVSRHEFINYDDPDYVTGNGVVQQGLTKEGLAWAFGNLHGEKTYWHPVTWLSHMLDCQWFGLKPGAHHLVNVLLHVINAVLVFFLFKRMTGAVWRSAVVAALFALHPLQVDTVAWVSERKNVLSTLFCLLTLGAYVRYVARPGLVRYLGVLVFFILGLMSKPTLVTLPCVLLLLDFWPLGRLKIFKSGGAEVKPTKTAGPGANPQSPARHSSVGWLLLEKLPLFVLAIASGIVTILAHRGLGMGSYEVHRLPMRLRVENAFVSYARYVGKAIWPAKLSILYPHPGVWPAWQVAGSAALLLAVTGAALWNLKRRPSLAVGWFWFLGVLVPAIGLVQVGVQAMADRFAYVPVIGLFVLIVWGVSDWASAWRQGKVYLGIATGAALAACTVLTSLQLRHWQNSITLFEHVVRVTTNNFVAQNFLSIYLLAAGKPDEALIHVSEALLIRPEVPQFWFQRGEVFAAQHRPAEAIEQYRQAAQLNPKWSEPVKSIGNVLLREGKTNEAIAQYVAANKMAPDDWEAHARLAQVLAAGPDTAAGIEHYREALRLKPDWPETLNNLAWLLATHPNPAFRDGAEAVRLAERACALTGRKRVLYIGTLAAAYAEAGKFGEAVRTAQEARDLAAATGETELAAMNEKLRQLYQAGKPYREGAE